MEVKKGPMNGIIQDAIASMDIDPDSQKPVNVPTSSESSFNEKLANAQKADRSIFDSGGNFDENESVERNDSRLLSNKIAAIPVGSTENFGSGFSENDSEDKSTDTFNSKRVEVFDAISPGNVNPSRLSVDGPDKYVRWFSDLNNKDIKIAGGKGASLGEMFNNKFPVPPGFVITAQAFDFFMTRAKLKDKIYEIIQQIDMEDTEELQKASKIIRKLIENEEIPDELSNEIIEAYHILGTEKIDDFGISSDALNILKNSQEPVFVSVRSSATTEDLVDASFAGQQESFLNVKGDSSLIEHVKRCFSSLYTPRAIYYRNKKGFREGEALLAAVVQKMIDSEKSGVVFSRDPVNMDDNIAIEAVFGLGEGIVSGKIKPDHYVVSRDLKLEDVKILNKKIAIVRTGSGQNEIVRLSDEKSRSQVLSSGEILEIANQAIKLEDHYNNPQDIEFAVEGGEVYILQSRPITTLGNKSESKELQGNVILEGQSASPGIGVGTVKIIKSMDDLHKIKKGDVLVTEMTNPDMVVAMQKSAAIVTDEGGMTSHAAIVSREMGIPAIVGTETATRDLKDGMRITVDGANGKVYEGEVAESQTVEIKKAVETSKIKIKVIVDLPDFAERAAETGLDTVGLTRLEGIIANMKKHPLQYEKEGKLDEYTKIIEEGLSKILSYFQSVWFRASDVRTDEYSSLEGAPEREINPMLGFHGIRFSLKHPEILKAELEAMKRVAAANPDKKIGIMFPQVILIEEVREAKKYFDEFKLDNMEFGVMIETPAAVQIIEDICKYVDFVSFGTNDLTQYTLAIDRNNEDVQYLYNELHPAIFSQIEKVIDACNSKNVESSICGQAGSKKEMAEFLFKKGIKSISVNADAAYDISRVIKELEDNFVEPVKEVSEEVLGEELEDEEGTEEKDIKHENIEVEEELEATTKVPVREIIIEHNDWGKKAQLNVDVENQDSQTITSPEVLDIAKKEEPEEEGFEEGIYEAIVRESPEEIESETVIEREDNRKVEDVPEGGNEDKEQTQDKKDEDYRKSKKYQRYLKWKEKKKLWREKKLEEKKNHWDKKAMVVGGESEESKKKIERGSDKMKEENNRKPIEPVNDLDRIDEKTGDIQEGIEREKRGDLAESAMTRDNTEVKDETISPDENTQEHKREELLEDIDEAREQGNREDEIDELENEEKLIVKKDILQIDDREDSGVAEKSEGDASSSSDSIQENEAKNLVEDFSGGSGDENEGSSGGSGDESNFKEVGVYNPDEGSENKEGKQKYSYNFEDWE